MKIILTDNYCRCDIPDELIAENLEKEIGTKIVKLLNKDPQKPDTDYYELVEDNHKLYNLY